MEPAARLSVDCCWHEYLGEPNSRFWVSFSRIGDATRHGFVQCRGAGSDGQLLAKPDDGFTIHELTRERLQLTYADGANSVTCCFQAPVGSYRVHGQSKKVTCLDVTSGGLAISAAENDSNIAIWETSTGNVRRTLKGSVGDICSCRFFPSGVVVLTGGADMRLRVWPVDTGDCRATFVGHHGGVEDTAIVERGRNIISCSRDGTAILWDVGRQNPLATFNPGFDEPDLKSSRKAVNCCSLGVTTSDQQPCSATFPGSESREIGTQGKLLLLALENGSLVGYGLDTREKVLTFKFSDSVNCCTFVTDTLAVCGMQDGTLSVIDIRNTMLPIRTWKESRSAIRCLAAYSAGFIFGSGDGSTCYVDAALKVVTEYTGSDCDPIYRVAADGKYLYTASRDGAVRKYSLVAR